MVDNGNKIEGNDSLIVFNRSQRQVKFTGYTICMCVHVYVLYATIEHMHILADLMTLLISQLEKLVSSLAASLTRAPKRIRLE